MSNPSYQNSKPPVFSSHIGTPSILLVFVVLSLVSFAALSIVSASADRLLTGKVEKRVHSYYEAHNQAQNVLSELDFFLMDGYYRNADETAYFSYVEDLFTANYNAAEHSLTYNFPLSDTQQLNLTVEVLYPASADTHTSSSPFYSIRTYRVETNTESLEYNETLPVLNQGE